MMTRAVEDAHAQVEVVVEAVEAVADGVVALTLRAKDAAPLPDWHPGAHLDLVLHDGDGVELVRQYSLCGSVGAPTWRVGVLREPAGRGGSRIVHDVVRTGDVLLARGPRNNFPLVDAPAYLFLAGGIGVTPMLPMLAEVVGRGVPWRFVYGGRTRSAMAFVDEVLAHGDGVVLVPQDTDGLLPLRAELTAAAPGTAVYCCGPEPLLVAVEQACAELGLPAPHLERFSPKEITADTGGDRAFEVVLEQSGGRYEVPVGKSIIEVLEAAGVDVLSSCQEGVCGTCEQRILAGTVDHRDSLLSDQEKAENEFMMICVSRATSAELVLDM